MTDRTRRVTVILDEAYRTDDVEAILNAIRMIRGVLSVKVNVLTPTEMLAIQTARHEIRSKLYAALEGE